MFSIDQNAVQLSSRDSRLQGLKTKKFAPRKRRLIGLMGGSFNPAHNGHRSISLFAHETLGLSEVWWMVSPGNPLKAGDTDMAPLAARVASAQAKTHAAPIKATCIEQVLGTRYTKDTLRAMRLRYARHDFIWLMGADNLKNFHQWRQWREIARQMPIAVIARPGYNGAAMTSPAMAWFARFVRPRDHSFFWTQWSTPALVILRFRPDPRSATAIRRTNPHWHKHYANSIVRDDVTHMILPND